MLAKALQTVILFSQTMRGIMSDTLSVHISAFNSEIYQEEIAKLFPELKLSISNGRDTHDRLYDCDILIGFGVGLNNEVFDRNKNYAHVFYQNVYIL